MDIEPIIVLIRPRLLIRSKLATSDKLPAFCSPPCLRVYPSRLHNPMLALKR